MIEFFLLFVLILVSFFILYQKISQQSQINLEQQRIIQDIKERLLLESQLQNHLKEGLEKTRDLIEELKKDEQIRSEREKEFLERIKRIDEIIGGTSAKGISGEEILRETFKKLPAEMIETNFQVNGKVVEFALILPNGKRLPIDSKWVAGRLVVALEKETDQQKRKEIIEEIEKEVMRRIKEVRQYIDPHLTWGQAIAAVPDSVYAVCRNSHLKAREENVILMPYSMVLPLILYFYRLHLQYSISLDIENLQNHLISVAKNLDQMENILENKIYRGATMVSNAYSEYKQLISRIRSSIEEIKLKRSMENKKLNNGIGSN
jgi:DNA recombination protein RmuC